MREGSITSPPWSKFCTYTRDTPSFGIRLAERGVRMEKRALFRGLGFKTGFWVRLLGREAPLFLDEKGSKIYTWMNTDGLL